MASLIVATDLDSCLLDEDYRHDAAAEALAALGRAGVPLVLASSKTRAEMEPLWRELGLAFPFIVENGGAVVASESLGHPREQPAGDLVVVPLGVPRERLVEALGEVAAEVGAPVEGFAHMTPGRIAELTGLPPTAARRAAAREWDEPFLCVDADLERLRAAAEGRGLRVTGGGRFRHLCGPADKGRALRELLSLLSSRGRVYSCIALGDAPNDLGMLRVAERPIVVPRPDGRPHPVLQAALPRAERAPAPGPVGWNAAVLAVLAGQELPRVAA